MSNNLSTYDFGFLNFPHSIDFCFGRLLLHENFQNGMKWMRSYQHEDGNLYPSLVRTMSLDIKTMEPISERPNTRRPARVFDLPVSHSIAFDDACWNDDICHGDGAFIVHLCAMLFETRLQFSCWKIDSKTPVRKPSFWISKSLLEDVLCRTYTHWRGLLKEHQKKLIHILYMHGRGAGCEWSWLKFIVQYMVFDSIYKYLRDLGGVGYARHSQRIFKVCEALGADVNSEFSLKAILLRNELVHESSIEGVTPGTVGDDIYIYASWLYRLNQRLICSIIGYENKFSKSAAHAVGAQYFDPIRE